MKQTFLFFLLEIGEEESVAEPEVSLPGLQASEEEIAGSGFRTSPALHLLPLPCSRSQQGQRGGGGG